jgi:metal-responsive CopG/Arc/MetJ family transcriptional regulator
MPKAKVSVTVERSLIRECDRLAGKVSRSEVFEKALTGWLREARRKSLEGEVERYYRSLRRAERNEDSRWANLALRFLGETWK